MARSRHISDVSLITQWLLLAFLAFSAVGCVSNQPVKSIDLSKHRGVFVVVFMDDPSLRRSAETQLTAEMRGRGIEAFPSVDDIEDVTTSSAEQVAAAARARGAAAVVIVNPMNRDGSGGALADRVSPQHPDLQAFFEQSRHAAARYSPGSEAILEVDLFALGDEHAELFWSGTVRSFTADGTGAAIPGLSAQIAEAMARARVRLLGD